MKNNKLFAGLALVLGMFFFLQFGAEFFFALARDKVPAVGLKHLKKSSKLFPLMAAYPSEAGFSLLEKGLRDTDAAAVKQSTAFFLAAIKKNALDYKSRYYLAKAYLWLSSAAGDYFDMAVQELTRAARIRASNAQIAIDCGKVFFSVWPLLEETDQRFAAGLLADAMPLLSWEDFSGLLEQWSLYVQDAPLLMSLLTRRPDFFGPAANQLVAQAIPLSWRWQLLEMYEGHMLDANERLYNEKALKKEMDGEQARNMLNHLKIRGYFRLQPESSFKEDRWSQLQRRLLLDVIASLLDKPDSLSDPRSRKVLTNDIQAYVADLDDLNSLGELQKVLEEKGFFQGNDFSSLRLKTLIAYKKGDYSGIIAEIEALRKTISFVKKEQLADYTDILLLLVDAYYRSKLLTVAETIARELYREQPDSADVLWRVLRIQKVLGDEGEPDVELNEKLARVENSRFLTIAKQGIFDVFLFNQPEIEIVFDPALRAGFKDGKLLQVFVDGKIAYEAYTDAVPEKIVIGKPFTDVERKVKVQVTVI